MKKILITLSLFLALSISVIAQGVTISGSVTDGNGAAITNHPVYIQSDSSAMFMYFNTVYTNANGVYTDLVPTTMSQGLLFAAVSSACVNTPASHTLSYNPAQMAFANVDFSVCGTVTPPSCNTTFTSTVTDSIATFTVNTTGGTAPYTYSWDYGNGTTGAWNSNFYAANGSYLVCVTVTDAAGCISAACDTVNITSYGTGNPCNTTSIVNVAFTNPTSCGVADGTITIIATGSSLEYSIDGGTNWQASNVFTGLASGAYSPIIRKMNGSCAANWGSTIMLTGQNLMPNATVSVSGNTASFQAGTIAGGAAPYTYFWDFGDSSVSTVANPSHTYNGNGFYVVCVTVTDAAGCSGTSCTQVTIGNTNSCTASYTYSTTATGAIGFTNTSTSNGAGSLAYMWDFGDGNTSWSQNPTHTYSTSGTYLACLTIMDSLSNCYDTYCDTLLVQGSGGSGCAASFSYQASPSSPQVWFAGMATGGTAPYTYSWDFGDSSVSTVANPSHTYATSGAYTVTLTITDATGCSATYSTLVIVQGSMTSCSVDFTHTVSGSTASFVATANGNGGPYMYSWDFGDGNTSSLQNPTHTYASDGMRSVCVTLFDSLGCFNIDCDSVVINTGTGGTNNIGGIVLKDSAFATAATVYLYLYDSSAANHLTLIAQTPTVQGAFNFSIPSSAVAGDYVVRAALTSSDPDFAIYLPTYYMQSLAWNGATLVNLTPSTSAQIIIPLINGTNTGIATGQNYVGGTVALGTYTPPSGMIIWRTVILMDENQEPITHAFTDANGDYGFGDLADGVYYVLVEEPGLLSTPIQVTVNSNTPTINNVDFKLDENYVTFTATNKVTSIEKLSAFPNPVRDQLNIQLVLNKDVDMNVSILNVTGQVMSSEQYNLYSGENRVNVLMNDLPAGIYMLRLQSNEGVVTQKVVKQ